MSQTNVAAFVELSDLNGNDGFVINGVSSNDNSGYSISGAGDFNGDGFSDLLIGAPNADPNAVEDAGQSYVLFGGTNVGNAGQIELSQLDGSNGFAINGVDQFDMAGWSVSSAGDINGDGADDLIIGAWNADPGGKSEAGETYVLYGGTAVGSSGLIELSILDGSDGFVISGIDEFDQSGWSVGGAADLNGDGIDDLLISALNADPNGDMAAGESYVLFGGVGLGSTGQVNLATLDPSAGFVINGIDADDNSGWSASIAGDVNNDGVPDLIIGALFADPGGNNNAGETYVVFGGIGVGNLELSALDGSNGFVVGGINEGDFSGYSVAGVGDVNSDGIDDLMIGAIGADFGRESAAGIAYVVFGEDDIGTTGVLDISTLDGSNGYAIYGNDEDDNSGWVVSGSGDINGDGVSDLLIGAPTADPNGTSNAGETYLVFGGTAIGTNDGKVLLSALPGTAGFTFNGTESDDFSGYSVSGIGDFNGDNIGDLLIGARSADANGNSEAGKSYVVFGKAWKYCHGHVVTVDLSLGESPTSGDDVIVGTSGSDIIRGGAGDDIICGMGGDDFIHGNSGDDWIDGGEGVDNLRGGTGNDVLHTGPGATVDTTSRVSGGSGNDEIHGGIHADDLRGGKGRDTINGGGGDDVLRGGADNDVLNSGNGDDILKGGNGDSDICRVTGDDDELNDSCETVAGVNNVLFILVDDMNWWTSAMIGTAPGVNASVLTPNIDRIANRGTYFTNAHVSSGSCKPSRAGIWSGLRSSSTGIYANSDQRFRQLHPDYVTLDRYFKANGYHTVSYGKTFHGEYQLYEQFDEQINTSNLPLPPGAYPLSGVASAIETAYDWGDIESVRQGGRTPEETAADLAIGKLTAPGDGRPLFLTVGMKNPHLPLHFTTAEADLFFENGDMLSPRDLEAVPRPDGDESDISPLALNSAEWDTGSFRRIDAADAHQAALGGYLGAVAHADSQIGRILDILDDPTSAYQWNNTTVVFTSDHGRHLGDKQNYHKNTLWDPSTRVPLIIWSPSVPNNSDVVEDAVSTIDIYPTLLDIESLAHRSDLDGVSLAPALDDDPNTIYRRRAVVTAKRITARQLAVAPGSDDHYSIQVGQYRYIRWGDGSIELYDSVADPYNFDNLAHASSANATGVPELLSTFAGLIDGQRQPNLGPSADAVTIRHEDTEFELSASDPNGDFLTFTVLSLPSLGQITSVSNSAVPLALGQKLLADESGIINLRYLPNNASAGNPATETANFSISDGRHQTVEVTLTIRHR